MHMPCTPATFQVTRIDATIIVSTPQMYSCIMLKPLSHPQNQKTRTKPHSPNGDVQLVSNPSRAYAALNASVLATPASPQCHLPLRSHPCISNSFRSKHGTTAERHASSRETPSRPKRFVSEASIAPIMATSAARCRASAGIAHRRRSFQPSTCRTTAAAADCLTAAVGIPAAGATAPLHPVSAASSNSQAMEYGLIAVADELDPTRVGACEADVACGSRRDRHVGARPPARRVDVRRARHR